MVGNAGSWPARRTNRKRSRRMKSTACLQGVPSWLCSVRFFDEAIDLAVRCTTAGRQITAVLTDALATKLHGDPRSEYSLEWTEEERLDSAFLVVSALHMRLCAGGACWTLGRFHLTLEVPMRFSSAGSPRGRLVRRLNAWALMKVFLPKAWRCPPDFVISEAADRRMERLMSRRTQTTWPWSGALLFPSGPTASTFI